MCVEDRYVLHSNFDQEQELCHRVFSALIVVSLSCLVFFVFLCAALYHITAAVVHNVTRYILLILPLFSLLYLISFCLLIRGFLSLRNKEPQCSWKLFSCLTVHFVSFLESQYPWPLEPIDISISFHSCLITPRAINLRVVIDPPFVTEINQ